MLADICDRCVELPAQAVVEREIWFNFPTVLCEQVQPCTANILNLPQSDAESYKQSSPIYFANGLKGALLICHGMVDTNVNFQDTVRLVEKLIELRKENWQVAPYPVEDHTFDREASWADEYKRILKLFVDNLKPDVRMPSSGRGRAR